MLRHHHIPNDHKAKLGANFFEHAKEAVAAPRAVEVALSPITTGGDEVEMALSVVALEAGGHSGGLYKSLLGNHAVLAHPVVPKTGTKDGAPKIRWATRRF